MVAGAFPEGLILVLDTCGDGASMALFRGSELIEERTLLERTASAALLGALREMMAGQNATARDLAAIGVVNGPGSFTGVRVGLALAKGLCEATGVPLAAVSRLRVLADAAGLASGFALLKASRDEVFVRAVGADGREGEWLSNMDQIRPMMDGREVAVASQELAARIREGCSVRVVELTAAQAMGAVLECLQAGGSEAAATDANYGRNEEAIYRKQASASGPSAAGRV